MPDPSRPYALAILCSLEYIACGRRTRYVLRTLDSEVHPSCIHGLKHFFRRSGVALRDAELLERFRPPCTRDCKGFHLEIQDFTQASNWMTPRSRSDRAAMHFRPGQEAGVFLGDRLRLNSIRFVAAQLVERQGMLRRPQSAREKRAQALEGGGGGRFAANSGRRPSVKYMSQLDNNNKYQMYI